MKLYHIVTKIANKITKNYEVNFRKAFYTVKTRCKATGFVDLDIKLQLGWKNAEFL